MRTCGLLAALICLAAAESPAQTDLLRQYQFESKLWPNLHHFLYVLGRARNFAPDRERVAVRQAPLDVEGFDALPDGQRKAWNEALETYRTHAAPLDISYSSLIDVNYALADLPENATIESAKGIPPELATALREAGPVYRALWWPRHDAANQAWVRQLKPLIERYGGKIAEELAAALKQPWPAGPLRVEVVAYATWAGAYTTDDPTLITMSSLNEEHRGSDGLEQLFHETGHHMMDTVDAGLRKRAKAAGIELSRDVSHAILFYTAGEMTRRVVPGHIPYATHYGVWQRGMITYYHVLTRYWQPYLDGKISLDQALDEIVRVL